MEDQKSDKPVTENTGPEKAPKPRAGVIELDVDLASRDATDGARPPRKYSKRNKSVQEFERRVSKGLHRVAKSVEAGLREWRAATDRSSRKRKDGAIRDALENSARAVGKQIRVASRVPEDAVRAVRALKVMKALRRVFPL
jgi:hypothetical protein